MGGATPGSFRRWVFLGGNYLNQEYIKSPVSAFSNSLIEKRTLLFESLSYPIRDSLAFFA